MCTAFSAPSDSSQPNFTNSAAFSATMPKTVSAGDGRFRPPGLLRTLVAPRRWPGAWAAARPLAMPRLPPRPGVRRGGSGVQVWRALAGKGVQG